MKTVIYLFILSIVFSSYSAHANQLNCIQNGEDGNPWLIYTSDITPQSELLNISVKLAGTVNISLSNHLGPSKGYKTNSQNPTFYGYVKHLNISHFTHPGGRQEFAIDLSVPGDLISMKGRNFIAYSAMRSRTLKEPTIWRVSCSVR